jgi:hypothetical protein
MSNIERELEFELHRVLDPLSGEPVPPLRAPVRGHLGRTLAGGAGAALSLKLLTGVAAAAAVVTVAGVATTGSINPVDWGQQVSQGVAACKQDLATGQHGIGDCVSDLASTHGSAVASAARQHGQGNGDGSANAHGNNPNANEHAKDKKDHPVPTPKGNSAGDPTDPSSHAAVTPPPPHP